MNDIDMKNSIRSFIEGFVRRGVTLDDDRNIFQERYVNSLFAMQLVLFVESTLGCHVEPEDMDLKNFCSINAIHRFVQAKQAAGTAA
jgi:acyl carrier protein